jgi:predicted ribosome quality control (RQC) complex YloA/Tae2 family protein
LLPGFAKSIPGFFALTIFLVNEQAERRTPSEPSSAECRELAAKARKRFRSFIKRKERLLGNLEGDLLKHGDAETWRRYGDLILANMHNAEARDGSVTVVDYFDETAPTIEIPVEPGMDLKRAAENFYRRSAKARHAAEEIEKRRSTVQRAIRDAEAQLAVVDDAEAANNLELLRSLAEPPAKAVRSKPIKGKVDAKRYRRFVSSDGYEILVGKAAADNDYLTFRVSNSLDIWLHAADHPGSHVIVRLPKGIEIPPKTLSEAAQLAGFYSSGKKQPKLEVRYTQRKFVHKPRKAPAGLVSLSKFKSILVEPKVPFDREDGP